jgi:hypothetical protein
MGMSDEITLEAFDLEEIDQDGAILDAGRRGGR